MRRLGLVFCLLLAGVTAEAASKLAVKEMEGWTIVVASDAIPSEQHAARFFQRTFADITGVVLPIAGAPVGKRGAIYIGPGSALKARGSEVSGADLGGEDLRIKIEPQAVVIIGGRPRGTLYGVYEFFERYLGVRYLTFDHTYLPSSAKSSSLPLEDFTYRPPFAYRCSYYSENYEHREFSSRLRVNIWSDADSLGGSTHLHVISHSFYQQVPAEKYGKSHPEYFALINGVRQVQTGRGPAGPQLDVSNPEVIDVVAQAVLQQLKSDPTLENVSVSQNDNYDYCRCDSCEAINRREGSPMGAQLRFVNAVAERVEQKYPHVKVGTLAYQYTRKPPRTLKPRDNVQIQLATIECCVLHTTDDPRCPKNRDFHQDFVGWRRICRDLWIWGYTTDFLYYDLPFPNLKSIGPDMLSFKEGSVHGVFMQGNWNGRSGEMSDLRNYIVSRCLWDPTLDSWTLAGEFCKLQYGRAASQIIAYLTMIHENAQSKGLHPSCYAQPADLGLDSSIAQRSIKYFDRALALAENSTVRSRVEKASIPAYRAMIESGMTMQVQGRKLVPHARGGAGTVVDRYIALSKKYGVSMADEGTPFPSFEKKLQTRLEGIPAARIENKTWRLTLAPANDGKIVELLHKPSGRNFLAGVRRDLARGTIEEVGQQGYDAQNPPGYSVQTFVDRAVLRKALSDGSVLERTISLDSVSGKVQCKTSLAYAGESPKAFQFLVRAELVVETKRSDSSSVSLFLHDRDWRRYSGLSGSPQPMTLSDARNGVAFFNSRLKGGLSIMYDEGKFQTPTAQKDFSLEEIDVDLPTRTVALSRGESFIYSYTLEYLKAAPAK